ncbi:MAG: rRNA maturation RNase YbeY [bacterium]
MNLLFDNVTDYILDDNLLNLIDSCILETFKLENFEQNFVKQVEISISVVGNKNIQKINQEFRGIDKPTDVLSFPILDKEILELLKDNDAIGSIILLGDIIISIDKVLEQSNEYNHSVERELCFLVVHSMLHLLGYDHMNPEDEKEMFAKQDIILNNLNILR